MLQQGIINTKLKVIVTFFLLSTKTMPNIGATGVILMIFFGLLQVQRSHQYHQKKTLVMLLSDIYSYISLHTYSSYVLSGELSRTTHIGGAQYYMPYPQQGCQLIS